MPKGSRRTNANAGITRKGKAHHIPRFSAVKTQPKKGNTGG